MEANSSPPALAMTIPRMFAAFFGIVFMISILKKFLRENLQNLIIKGLACLSILVRVLAIVMLKYYTRNPTEQCFVSQSAGSALTYMDIVSCLAIGLLAWQYLRELKMQKMKMI